MPRKPRAWTEYPPEYLTVANSIATASLPALYGPYTLSQASTFQRGFYAFRRALQAAQATPDSHTSRLSQRIDKLSISKVPSGDPTYPYNIVFDLSPMTITANRIDPAGAQIQELTQANFVAARQRPPTISEPIFSDEEMRDRLDDISRER